MNPNPESRIRNPESESESEFERREILSLLNSIQSNSIQSNCSCPNDIRSSCVDARERIYRLFGKNGQGKRRQIVRAVFFIWRAAGAGQRKTAACPRYAGEGIPSFAMGRPGRKEHRERHKKREKQGKNDDMLLTGDGRRRFLQGPMEKPDRAVYCGLRAAVQGISERIRRCAAHSMWVRGRRI